MLFRSIRILAVLICALTVAHAADEAPLKSTIVSVGLFKNGLCVVKREVKLPGAGTFAVDDVPEPIHGTWSVQCDVPVETRVAEREIVEPVTAANLDFQKSLAGKHVTIRFRDGQIPPAEGTVEALPEPKPADAWNRTYQQPQYGWNYYPGGIPPPAANANRFLILKTEGGRVYIDSGMIAYLNADGKDQGVKTRKPVLLLTAAKEADKPVTATITYLSKGLAWAPNYRIDISDPKQLSIEQAAVIKNELTSLENTEMQLISGYPSVQVGHVTSPLSLRTTWAQYFQQVREQPQSNEGNPGIYMNQQSVSNGVGNRSGMDLSAVPAGEGVDVYYQPIGPRTLAEGESLALTIDRQKAEYERIVEWLITDSRDVYGRIQNVKSDDDGAWDAVRFRNPFKFPMTTAPAMVVSGDHFNGQRMSCWVNTGEETIIQVNHALSIRTSNSEHEIPGAREEVWVGNTQYHKVLVNGELKINNHRKEDVKVVIRRKFSGELISADGEPKKGLLEDGVYAINPRNELVWTITLKSGEEKALAYKYSVLSN